MTFRVTVLPKAQQDIEDTYNFIASVQQELHAATRWLNGIAAAIESLASSPRRGRVIREQQFLGMDQEVRQVLYHNHRILYTVDDERVQVVHVRRGTRRDLQQPDFGS